MQFYFGMLHARLRDGKHVPDEFASDESDKERDSFGFVVPKGKKDLAEYRSNRSKDLKYVQLKIAEEKRNIEQLRESVSGSLAGGKRTVFVDSSDDEAPVVKKIRRESAEEGRLSKAVELEKREDRLAQLLRVEAMLRS